MSKANSTAAAGKSVDAVQTEQPSAYPKGPSTSGRINVQMVQNVLLIWLDSNLDDSSSSDCRNAIAQLHHVVNTINTFTDGEQCIDFLGDMEKEKACMVISGAFCQQIVPLVNNMPQVDSIFIFCGNKQYHEQWTKDWSKIKGVFTEITSICKALKQTAQQCEQSAISISIMDTSGDLSEKSLDQLDPSFMYTQIMKEILLTITFEQQHIDEFIEHCRKLLAENGAQLKHVDELARKYRERTPIWWYTCDCFLYPMLNRALRMMDADLMVKLGFFVGDLHRQIQQLHQQQLDNCSSNQGFTVYRGQRVTKEAFKKMVASKGGLLSFNCFLSTSKNRQLSLIFAGCDPVSADMVGVLFVMTIDPTHSTAPYASVADFCCFGGGEDEVLFSMNTVFRIGEITTMDENDSLVQVALSLTSDNDQDLRQLTDRIREETFPNAEGWSRLVVVLWKMGQPEKAEQVSRILLEQATEESVRAYIYNELGVFKRELGEYSEAIAYHEKSITINEERIPRNDQNLASSYSNIGVVYCSMGDYLKALSSYEKALAIEQQSLAPDQSDVASSYSNIGLVYYSIGDYAKALSSYEKALAIRQQSLPPNHPHVAASYHNIGLVYYSMGDYPTALSSYEKALTIRQQSLPSNHPDLAASYNNIGGVHQNMGDYAKALMSYEKALVIQQQSLPSNHPELAASYHNIAVVYKNMGDYPKALLSHEKALTIRQQSLPSNHPDLASSYNSIGVVYRNMGDYPKALSSHEKALAIQQQSLPPNHPDLASSYNSIGVIYGSMDDYSKALSFHEKALAIQQQSLPSNHPGLAVCHYNIGLLYESVGNYSKAYSSYERAVDVGQQSLPSNHHHLQTYRKKLADLKKKL